MKTVLLMIKVYFLLGDIKMVCHFRWSPLYQCL